MAKKQKTDAIPPLPDPRSIPNRDIMQRLNFMYQASVYLNQVDPSSVLGSDKSMVGSGNDTKSDATEQHMSSKKRARASKRVNRTRTTADLARVYVSNMRVVAQKTVVKMYVHYHCLH